MLLASVIIYLLLTIAIGFWASRRVQQTSDFMLAGKSLPIMLSTAALFATWFGSETVFGASSKFLEGGLYGVIEDPFGASLCLLLFGLFFARKLYGMNLLTLGDFFKVRFGKQTEIISSVFLVPSYFGYTAGQLVALGIIANVVAGIPVWEGVTISAVIVTLYTFVGGMWAVSVTDFIQGIIIVAGLVVLSLVLAQKAGGAWNVISQVPPGNFRFLPHGNATSVITYLGAWSVLGLGSIPSQDVFQRVMSSGSTKIAVRSCYYASVLYLTIAMLPLFISLCIKYLYPDGIGTDTQLALPRMVLAHMTMPVQILFFGSLLSAILSTTSSTILAPASILSENIIRPLSKVNFTDRQLLMITRGAVLLFSIGATIMAIIKSDIYELVGDSSVFSLVSLFVPMALGMYWHRSSGAGAILSMISGMIAWIIFEVVPIGVPGFIPAVLVSLLFMVVGSLVWPSRKYETHGEN